MRKLHKSNPLTCLLKKVLIQNCVTVLSWEQMWEKSCSQMSGMKHPYLQQCNMCGVLKPRAIKLPFAFFLCRLSNEPVFEVPFCVFLSFQGFMCLSAHISGSVYVCVFLFFYVCVHFCACARLASCFYLHTGTQHWVFELYSHPIAC